MKKAVFLFYVTCLFALTRCGKDEVITPALAGDSSPTVTIENIGDLHNQKCEEFFQKVSLRIKEVGCEAKSEIEGILKDVLGNENASSLCLAEFHSAGNPEAQFHAIVDNGSLSEAFRQWYAGFYKACADVKANTKKQFITDWAWQGKSLTGTEADYARIALNVFSSSFDYWSANADAWVRAGSHCDASGPNNEIEGIWQADVQGAVGGAIGGSLYGGVGFIPGGLAGGLGSSIGAAVVSFFEWLFG